ncbi:DNA-3-methyladenine glycosylase [Caulifigura coniformis]|uniref:DNA-3-methyladenine glycosylase II n=1 Tax=Caulifigura coniformis TaxID=2527983 RepID=A0A517S7I1_9PLAN|nr:DNA-3-methyladenine glycosylase [Caulifigura coniformis]QDT52073.1 DNA-3-methyladenine glycosylase [Caulifigura coniformis]
MKKKSAAKASGPRSVKSANAALISTLSPEAAEEGIRRLRKVDPILKEVIDRVGPFKLTLTKNRYHSLARAIVGQQISTSAARSIWKRLEALTAPKMLTADAIIVLADEDLRGAGLSPQKLRYFRDLALRVADGRLPLAKLSRMSDESVVEALVEVTGVGEWTAQMFLMFSLGRADVFAPDDLGIKTALKNLYALEVLPNKALALQIAEPWQPWRSIASWYLWRSLEAK